MIEYPCPCKRDLASSILEALRESVSFWFHLEQTARNCIDFYMRVVVSGSMDGEFIFCVTWICHDIFWKKTSKSVPSSTSIQREYRSFSDWEILRDWITSLRKFSFSLREEDGEMRTIISCEIVFAFLLFTRNSFPEYKYFLFLEIIIYINVL